MNESGLENNISVIIPDYLYESDGSLLSDKELSLTSDEEESGEYDTNVASSSNDYTIILSGIESSVYDLSSSSVASLTEQEMINNRLNRIEDNLNTCVCFLIVFTLFALIKICFAIFNKVLGLGQA